MFINSNPKNDVFSHYFASTFKPSYILANIHFPIFTYERLFDKILIYNYYDEYFDLHFISPDCGSFVSAEKISDEEQEQNSFKVFS